MTLPLEKTLQQMRDAVMTRSGVAESAAHNSNLQRVVDQFIRDAHNYYYLNAQWFGSVTRTDLVLTDGVQEYDWPDDAEPGSIFDVYAVSSSGQYPYKLQPMPSAEERYAVTRNVSEGRPQYYEYMDDVLRIFPAPKTSRYPMLSLTYRERETELVANSDRSQVDSRLVELRATISLLIHRSKPGVGERKAELQEMEETIMRQQNNRKSISMTEYAEPAQYYSRYASRKRQYNYADQIFSDQRFGYSPGVQ